MEKSIIKVNNLSFKYGDNYIFKNFNLDIYPGTFNYIIGHNGSGKSTLAKILSGILLADGYISIDSYLLNDFFIKKIRRCFSVCLDNSLYYFSGETVLDNLVFPLENLEYSKEEMDTLVKVISKKFKIENILDKSFDDITFSERIKVVVATAIINNPKIVLFDFSFDKLTSSDRKLVNKILLEYKDKYKLTAIFITHDLEDTINADNIILLDNGKVILSGSKEKVYKDFKLEKYGFNIPFSVLLSHNLMLYDLLDKVYFDESEVINKIWD